ncbi:MAG: hypothetical protein FWD69_11480 [Polyangiaceae bacterium]|nr:hypothetical protein [Polyangiaceae bacterium]
MAIMHSLPTSHEATKGLQSPGATLSEDLPEHPTRTKTSIAPAPAREHPAHVDHSKNLPKAAGASFVLDEGMIQTVLPASEKSIHDACQRFGQA